ncbi:MAG: hypothetical protein IT581_12825 [Verrucomicrobiales bacterium]|nr:hypothetical protein [Verrucomicrobiales bacterium]
MRYHSFSAPARPWLLGVCLLLALSLLPVRAVPFSVNLQGDYLKTVKDRDELPSKYDGSKLLYGVQWGGEDDDREHGHDGDDEGGGRWRESGEKRLFATTFSVNNLIASLRFTGTERPELAYFALQAGDDYAIWDIRSWNLSTSGSLLVFNDRITTTHTIRVPFFGTLKISVPDDITGIALYGSLAAASHGSHGSGDSEHSEDSDCDDDHGGGGSGGGGIVLGGDVGSHPTRVPDGGSVFALLAVGVAAAAFMTRRAS